MTKKEAGCTMIGQQKVFALKFGDNLAVLADFPEGLKDMLKSLEKDVKKN